MTDTSRIPAIRSLERWGLSAITEAKRSGNCGELGSAGNGVLKLWARARAAPCIAKHRMLNWKD
ncbi:hypothetical protein Dda_3547 [Drechslerella dactyloides]|uniref:Uncharacterized protein n=1 Tax=Drechslerella dactyloides TaxID=74499 RepID=A0AAD6IYL9_DREDA|nr:hypothetical protein Dda_3547 [Drechslerella dactyloides]